MVYLIHFEEKYEHAQHYIGFVDGDELLEERIKKHMTGDGAKIMKVVTNAGIAWDVVRTWPGADRKFERKLKNYKKARQLCPTCKKMHSGSK